MARCRSNSLGTRASSAGVLMSLSKSAVVVPLDLLFRIGEPVPSTSRVQREDLAVCTDLEPVFAAEVLCAFLHAEDPKDGRNVAAPQDLTVLLQERCRTTWTCSLFFQNIVNWFCVKRTELLFECFVRDNVVLIFHPLNHWPECCAIRSNQKPRGLPEPLGERRRFSLERWRFSQTLHVDKTLTFTLSCVCMGNRCLNCLSHCSRNIRQSR